MPPSNSALEKSRVTIPQKLPESEKTVAVRKQLIELIDKDLDRRGVDIADPNPRAPVGQVLPNIAPITGSVLIPLGRTISRIGIFLKLLKPGL
jgi:hypothetical protein